jgi:hypothetical protein
MPTEVNEWKKSVKSVELEVPSGNTCLARRVDLRKLLNAGSIPNLLMPAVREAMKGKKFDAEELMKDIDEDKIKQMLDLMDMIVVDCVLRPKVHPAPATEEARSDDILYVDEVDFEDKQFIFQWATGGSRDLERFRQEQESFMAGVHAGEGVEDSPISDPGDQGAV